MLLQKPHLKNVTVLFKNNQNLRLFNYKMYKINAFYKINKNTLQGILKHTSYAVNISTKKSLRHSVR